MNNPISAGILAGGQATRMGGVDKGLEKIDIDGQGEQSMVAHLVAQFRSLSTAVLISANRNIDQYKSYSEHVYPDKVKGSLGPLAGLHTLLLHTDTTRLITSPCDTPFLSKVYAQRMLQYSDQYGHHRICVASVHGRIEPLHLVLPVSYIDSMAEALEGNQLSVQHWLRSHDPVMVDFSNDVLAFRNINTLSDLKQHSRSA